MTAYTPEALKRVQVAEDPAQDEAARIWVDRTNGGDVAHVTVNPSLIDEEGREGYVLRAAIHGTLEHLRRYNRTMRAKYGTYEQEQLMFDDAMARAEHDIEQLLHHVKGGGERGDSHPDPEPGTVPEATDGGQPETSGSGPRRRSP